MTIDNMMDCHCRKMRRTVSNVTSFYDAMLASSSVTVNQYGVLREIRDHEECSVRELSEYLDLDRSTLARNLKPLIQRNLVADIKEKEARNSRLILTEEGSKVCKEAEELWLKAQAVFETKLNSEELEALDHALNVLMTL